jgi:hypothetical protein
MLVHCPVCPNIIAEQILSQYKVMVRKESDSEVGALATYRCRSGHIFFVRLTDLMRPETLAGGPYKQQFGNQ